MARTSDGAGPPSTLSAAQLAFVMEAAAAGRCVFVIDPTGHVVSSWTGPGSPAAPVPGSHYAESLRSADPLVSHHVYRALCRGGEASVAGVYEVGGSPGRACLRIHTDRDTDAVAFALDGWEPVASVPPMPPPLLEDTVIAAVEFGPDLAPDQVRALCDALDADRRIQQMRTDRRAVAHLCVDVARACDVRQIFERVLGPEVAATSLRVGVAGRDWRWSRRALMAAMQALAALGPDEWFAVLDAPRPGGTEAEGFAAAVADRAVELHVQPLVDVDRGRTVGGEVLARWRDEAGALRPPPAQVLARGDERVLTALDELVLDAAVPLAVEVAAIAPDLRIHVNLCDVSLRPGRDLLDRVAARLRSAGVDPATLVLEVLEYSGPDAAPEVDALRHAASLGFGLALDDAGAGARLDLFRDVSFGTMKLDRSLVQGLPGRRATEIVEGLVALADRLGAEVVAEGVETRAQLAHLSGRGVVVQGHLLHRPRSASAFLDHVREQRCPGSILDGSAGSAYPLRRSPPNVRR